MQPRPAAALRCDCGAPPRPRLLIVPGLNGSGPDHWQSWLQGLHRGARRVEQRDWARADLPVWSARIDETLADAGPGPWLAVAHSFGVLALVDHLSRQPRSPVRAALLVAPANPDRFDAGPALPQQPPARPLTALLSDTDPWLPAPLARQWAARWGARCVDLGDAGHINTAAGYTMLPFAQRWVQAGLRRLCAQRAGAAYAPREAAHSKAFVAAAGSAA
ncbi:MAG: alpha/beta hydrolase [Rubrivivax sp.]